MQQSVEHLLIVSFFIFFSIFGNCEEELPKKPVGRLSVNCRPTHYRQFTDRLPTANRQATDSFPKKKIVEKTRIKHDIETIIISIDMTGPMA